MKVKLVCRRKQRRLKGVSNWVADQRKTCQNRINPTLTRRKERKLLRVQCREEAGCFTRSFTKTGWRENKPDTGKDKICREWEGARRQNRLLEFEVKPRSEVKRETGQIGSVSLGRSWRQNSQSQQPARSQKEQERWAVSLVGAFTHTHKSK